MLFGGEFDAELLQCTGASGVAGTEVIQELWSGYGKIVRVHLQGCSRSSVIVKHIQPPAGSSHPRGWNTDRSHDRKVRSYQVETHWYKNWSRRCNDLCRIPQCLTVLQNGTENYLLLEDLDASGFPVRLTNIDWSHVEICLRWLANFHAVFVGENPGGLWETGTYWHLETRPDELEALDDLALKRAATAIDSRLNSAKYQTIVHGDAKLANFCFSEDGGNVAAVDFQYTGGGCGMKDVAYFIGSCLNETECEKQEQKLLEFYFGELDKSLQINQPELNREKLIAEWNLLYPLAWTDFHRFLKGWCPGHWKLNSYSERISKQVALSVGK